MKVSQDENFSLFFTGLVLQRFGKLVLHYYWACWNNYLQLKSYERFKVSAFVLDGNLLLCLVRRTVTAKSCWKISKGKDAEPTEFFEESVAQAFFDLENTNQDLFINSAAEIDVSGAKKAVVIHVPYRLRKAFRKIQRRLIRELEKKFSGKVHPETDTWEILIFLTFSYSCKRLFRPLIQSLTWHPQLLGCHPQMLLLNVLVARANVL